MASIEKRGNSYRINVSNGYSSSGQKILEHMTWIPSEGLTTKQVKKELEKQAFDFEQKVKSGMYLDGEKITFAEFADRWLCDHAQKQLKAKTIDWYRTMLGDRIIPAIGHIKLAKIQPNNIILFINNLQEEGIFRDLKYIAKDNLGDKVRAAGKSWVDIGIHPNTMRNARIGKPVSPATAQRISTALNVGVKDLFVVHGEDKKLSSETVTHYLRCISSVLSKAVEWQIIVANPCDRVKAPKRIQKKIRFMEIDEIREIMTATTKLDDIRIQTAVLIFLFSGIRKGELSALEWSDIDFESGTMTIERSMQYIRGKGLITTSTKSESGERIISLSASMIEQLKVYRSWQNEIRLKLGSYWIDRNRIFTRHNGDYIAPSTVYHWVKNFLIDNGHSEMTVHGLRHTNISLLLSQGVDVITVSRRAGHSRPSTTTDIYAHALRKPDEIAADKLEMILMPGSLAK